MIQFKNLKITDLNVHLFSLIVLVGVLLFYFQIETFLQTSTGFVFFTTVSKAFGYAAVLTGSMTFLLGPMSRIFPKQFAHFLKFRKALGLWSVLFLFVHSIIFLQTFYNWNFSNFMNFDSPYGVSFTSAIFSLIIFIVMTVTSTMGAVKKMGVKNWKRIQRTGYFALIFGAFHFVLFPSSGFIETLHGQLLLTFVIFAIVLKILSMILRFEAYHTSY